LASDAQHAMKNRRRYSSIRYAIGREKHTQRILTRAGIRRSLLLERGISILDSTLREGELFRAFGESTRLSVASLLAKVGVSKAELTVDYPRRTSADELDRVMRVLRDGGVKVVLHGRACEEDVERIAGHNPDGCGLYIAISRSHREHKLHGMTEESTVAQLCKSVTEARSQGMRYVRATLEDASRVYLEEGGEGIKRFGKIIERLREAGLRWSASQTRQG